MSLESGKAEQKSAHEGEYDREVPQEFIAVWTKSILKYPQIGQGMIAHVGHHLFSGTYSVARVAEARLSDEQLALVAQKMRTAHTPRDIAPVGLQSPEAERFALRDLWDSSTLFRVLCFAHNYVNEVRGMSPVYISSDMVVNGVGARLGSTRYAKRIEESFAVSPKLREEVALLFLLMQEALAQPEMQTLEKERRDLLNYKKHGKPSRMVSRLLTKKARSERKKKNVLKNCGRESMSSCTSIWPRMVQSAVYRLIFRTELYSNVL